MDNVKQFEQPKNRKQRRAEAVVARKATTSMNNVGQLQEGLNRLIGRFNELLPEIADLKRQVAVFGKLVDEVNNLKATVRGMDAAVAAIGRLSERQGLFSQQDVQNEVEKLFDEQYGLKDREGDGEFNKNDVLFLKYSIFDLEGKLLNGKTTPTMYVWGSGGIPGFEVNAQNSKLNDKTVYMHDLPMDYPVKFLAGQTIRVEYEIVQVKQKIAGGGENSDEIDVGSEAFPEGGGPIEDQVLEDKEVKEDESQS